MAPPNCEAAGKAGAFLGLYAMMSMNGGCGKFVRDELITMQSET